MNIRKKIFFNVLAFGGIACLASNIYGHFHKNEKQKNPSEKTDRQPTITVKTKQVQSV